jgi:hypothetical protein
MAAKNILLDMMVNGGKPQPVAAYLMDPVTGEAITPSGERAQQTASLLTNATQNGAGNAVAWQGGRGTVFVSGVWGGATVALEAVYGGQAHAMGTQASATSNAAILFELPAGASIQARISGASGTTNLNATVLSNRTI